ncbi:MAG: single-stranded-DNA-specific exonuclease RecJ [Sinobacteraceae bacterium]|nr:single-stranded-DNA-specific exonuclease RecJ [Nevskiaceae bacterium]MCP5339677.1 single-stranded-DNA-specific exonuclease RecJ [Nevskiaceae bacterium]
MQIVRRPADAARVAALGSLHPVLARAYAARGVAATAELSPALERLLPVGTLEHVGAAVELLLAHRNASGRVLVVGDFDADGATSTALILRALQAWGFGAVDFLVPNRFEFGYGLTPEIVELAATRAPTLIVTVDNGISSLAGVAAARARGIEVLVTDHHLPGQELPAANVIVNPNLADAAFGSRALAGVGVAFYVMAALYRELERRGLLPADAAGRNPVTPASLLDLVALGTVADLVPLDANNRVLVAQGLQRIRAGRCAPGIRALLEVGGRAIAGITAADLGFAVGPRLNAAGRLDDMSIGIRCLLADSPLEAQALAARLDQLNQERRAIEAAMQEQALAAVRGLRDSAALQGPRHHGVCLFDPGWHQGVVGLVASRIKDRVRRPVIAFADAGEGWLRGSARSVAGVHVRDVLDAIATREPGLLARFGGHAMAAGLTLAAADLDRFARAFDAEVARWQAGGSLADRIETDGELALDEICLATAEAVRGGGPWGQAFPEPTFDGRFAIRSTRVVGEKHLKMWVEAEGAGARRSFDAIAFNFFQGREPQAPLPEGAQLVYRLDVNEWRGERRLQLLVDHVLP